MTMTAILCTWLEERRSGVTLGIGETMPRISWNVDGSHTQTAYEIELTSNGTTTATGRVASSSPRLIAWPFAALQSRTVATIRVRIWHGSEKTPSAWGEPLTLETGLLHPEDWAVDFVSPSPAAPHLTARPAYLLRATFYVDSPIVRARIYATAHGVYELEVNGKATNDELLAPGWSSYEHRLRYQTHDITHSVQSGKNVIGAWLADGWYRGRLGFNGGVWDNYGADVSLLAQLELTTEDGTITVVPLEREWLYRESPITAVGLYEGEDYDSTTLPAGWSTTSFDAAGWQSVSTLPRENFTATIEAPTGPPVRVTERLAPVAVRSMPNGRVRLDFGQNISGKLQISVTGARGHTITLHHAEELDAGELAIRPLRSAASIDRFICNGEGAQTWTPRFTYHGFRYAELENWPGEFDPKDVVALVLHTDMERTGWFESSNPLLNRLHDNVLWSMRDNFVDLPTDCPQRDERLGWTGDIQVFAPTASFLYAVHGTLQGWLRDLSAEQKSYGSVPNFVPWIECGFPPNPAAAWGDAAVILPWTLYERYGDTAILDAQYESMKAWVDQVASLSSPNGLWNEGFQLGDWLDPAAPPDDPAASRTDKYLVSTAYRAHSTRLLAKTAVLLGKTDDAAKYAEMARTVVSAFQSEFVTPNGRLASDTPTAYSTAIIFDLLQPAQRETAGKRLAILVGESDYRISTGFVGTPIICDALVATGSIDVAYYLLLQENMPSWLYPVTMGATTIWERWDSMLPDGSINSGEMTSFNHYALGAVADFMHRIVAGLSPSSPGYATMHFAPKPGGGLTSASASHVTPYGLASSSWSRAEGLFTLNIEVPGGTSATVLLPDGRVDLLHVGPGEHTLVCAFRDARDDLAAPAAFNIHNPEHRAARDAAQAA
jgi:alpha-L-rhamnosidase